MIFKEEMRWKGKPVTRDAVRVGKVTFILSGRFLKTASVKREWQDDVTDPEAAIRVLKDAGTQVDLLKFWQRIPESEPKYSYYKEWREIAAIPVTSYKHWFEKQISPKARNKIRKAEKAGVRVEQIELSESFVRGVMEIFNQSPVRRGKPFWHYGKDFATVKGELSADLDQSLFIGAYYKEELVGFIKFLITDRYAMTLLILDKTAHRDKAPMNAMIAKVVEICANRGIPYFTYTIWRRGDHGRFQESTGFERIPVPEYFVALSLRGKLALCLGLHRGVKGAIPEGMMARLLQLRAKWYSKYRPKSPLGIGVKPNSTESERSKAVFT
jgi:hypothetical protein